MPKHELLVLKDAAFTEACSWWDSGRERSSPSVTSAGSSKVNKLFHMTEQLDCSFSWINEVTTVQSLWPNALWGITLPVCLIWFPDVFLFTLTILWGFWRTLGIWQVHICKFISACSDHSSSCSSAPFEMQSWQKRLSWTCVQSHTLLWTCSWSASTSNPWLHDVLWTPTGCSHPQSAELKPFSFVVLHVIIADNTRLKK